MLYHRRSQDRGRTQIEWLDSRHSFSFGDYHDRDFMGFRTLRVINEDWIRAGAGFPTHGHRDMEIITYVIDGELAHRDSLGNGSSIRPGDVQIMSAGSGIQHSEYNSAVEKDTHLLQIWILPETKNLPPRYDQKAFSLTPNQLHPVCAQDSRGGALPLFQDAIVYAAKIESPVNLQHRIADKRFGWVQLIQGSLNVNGIDMGPGDGLAIGEEPFVTFASKEAEFLFFDLG